MSRRPGASRTAFLGPSLPVTEARRRPGASLIAFLGPSLPAAEARRRYRCTVLPPARQGDVWRALTLRPRAIALVDGVFEAEPSVWHHELLAALDAGVAVFGGASMGALRAAELERSGMVGVGQIFRWVRDGVVQDDSEVALLHAGPEHGHRPLTLPLVNVRFAAARAREERVLSAKEARALVEAASSIFYQERHWPGVLALAAPRWRRGTEARWRAFAAAGLPDLKRQDAAECLAAAAAFVEAAPPPGPPARTAPSSLVRRRRVWDGVSRAPGAAPVESRAVMDALHSSPGAAELVGAGLRRALLAGWARSMGLEAGPDRLQRAEADWLRGLRVGERQRAAFLAASGLDDAEAARLVEDLALEALVLEQAARLLPDGPAPDEALATESRMRGLWAAEVTRLARRRR